MGMSFLISSTATLLTVEHMPNNHNSIVRFSLACVNHHKDQLLESREVLQVVAIVK